MVDKGEDEGRRSEREGSERGTPLEKQSGEEKEGGKKGRSGEDERWRGGVEVAWRRRRGGHSLSLSLSPLLLLPVCPSNFESPTDN
jgi:hypothetical protein